MGNKIIEGLSAFTTTQQEIGKNILMLQFTVVNSFLIGDSSNWVIVDTGLENSADYIIETVKQHFGENNIPQSIILTHGHFDHIGSIIKLLKMWDVPIYIHELELPYITGQKDYPLPDPSTDEGLVSKMSPTFPHTSIDINNKVKPLPNDGSIPNMKDWRWIHTPGHTEGHISLFRESDKILIPGDAFCTVKQESLTSVITQSKTISGPPKYLTTDWQKAYESVKLLQSLQPIVILPSHGKPLKNEEAKEMLNTLVNDFKDIAIPKQGKYVE